MNSFSEKSASSSSPSSYDELIAQEEAAFKKVKILAKKIAQIGIPLASYSDGNCGYLINLIVDELENAGLYVEPKSLMIQRVRIGE